MIDAQTLFDRLQASAARLQECIDDLHCARARHDCLVCTMVKVLDPSVFSSIMEECDRAERLNKRPIHRRMETMSIHHRRILNDIVELGLDPRKSYTAKELEHHRRAHDLRKAEHGDAHALGAIAEPFDNTVVAPLTVDDAHLGPIALRPLEQSNPVYTAEEIADREEHCRLMEEALAAEEAQTIADQDVLETPASANPAAVEPESVAKQPRNALVEKPAKNEKPARAGGKFVKKAKTEEPPAEG